MTVPGKSSQSSGKTLIHWVKWPFVIIGQAMQWVFILMGLAVLGYSGKEFYDYHKFAHAYPSDGACSEVLQQLDLVDPERTRAVRCINAAGADTTGTRHLVFFSASPDDKASHLAGQGWITFAKLKPVGNGTSQLTEFLPIGFEPESQARLWPDNLVSYHANVQPHVPQPLEPVLTNLVRAAYHPMRLSDHYLDQLAEQPLPVDRAFLASPGYQAVLGNPDLAVLAVAVSEMEYENAKRYKNRFISQEWALQLHDGTALVHEVANKVNLYTPPQLLDPLPYQTVVSLSEMNRRYGP